MYLTTALKPFQWILSMCSFSQFYDTRLCMLFEVLDTCTDQSDISTEPNVVFPDVSLCFSSAPHPWPLNLFPSQRAVPINTEHIHTQRGRYTRRNFISQPLPAAVLAHVTRFPLVRVYLEYLATLRSVFIQANSSISSLANQANRVI